MRTTLPLSDGWRFTKENDAAYAAAPFSGEAVTLPHTWNALDGQDGGGDYYRGACWYQRALHAIAKAMDPSRLTTIANMSMTEPDSAHNFITDVMAYNHYFGWYGGSVEQNGPWFDSYHKANPQRALALSEYGAEAVLGWHTDTPKVKDYTEEYQAYYHERMLEAFAVRPYLWATYCWNMFDFAADARDEGGCRGRNNKGLVTYDRKLKKDAFFVYKAWWSTAPFVYIAGRRYVDRPYAEAGITVYSNLPRVTLSANGVSMTQDGAHVFRFRSVPLVPGENVLTAQAEGAADDSVTLRRVETPNPAYVLVQEDNGLDGAANWFNGLLPENQELQYPEGCYSIRDKFGELAGEPRAMEALAPLLAALSNGRGTPEQALDAVRNLPVSTILDFAGDKLPTYASLLINEQLNAIPKQG